MQTHTKSAGQSANPVAYIRGDGHRVSYQQAAIEQYAEAHDIGGLTIYTDHRADGEDYRVMFDRMLFDVGAGRFDTVLLYTAATLDHHIDELGELTEVARLSGATVITVAEERELTSAEGLFVARILAALTEFEQHDRERRRAYGARMRAGQCAAAAAKHVDER
jgi:DNA invertase Pin-like site-specific DNA recombinase